jgi:23S rRNA pseudouridine1911/1915/1917 synthase
LKSEEFSVESHSRLDAFLAEKTQRSRSSVQEQIKNSRVWVNNDVCTKASLRLKPNDKVRIQWVEEFKVSHLTPTPGNLNILYEDEFLLALNKAPGVIVHPGAGRKDDTLVHHLLHYLNSMNFKDLSSERPGIVHRLDEGTTGVLLVAKTEEAQLLLSNMFKDRAIKKTYQTITYGKMSLSGTIDTPIGRDRRDRKKMSSRSQNTKSALTQWKSIERFHHFTHVALFPHTGRTHQLRVHLSENGFPIVGDPTYGKKNIKKSQIDTTITDWLSQLDHTLLHAYSLELIHPFTKQPLILTAPLPQDFEWFLSLLKEHDS